MTAKRTRRRAFLDEMEKVVPWADLLAPVSPYLPEGKRGRPPFPPETMLRSHFIQQWFALSDPAMEEALHDMPVFREFAGLEGWEERLPDESTILRFRHVLEKHKMAAQTLQTVIELLSAKGVLLKSGTVVDATLIAAPSSTKNSSGERDPEMKQSRKGQQLYFGMKCHIRVDIASGLVHTGKGTSVAVNDVIEANTLVPPSDREVYADAGYQGVGKQPDARKDVISYIVIRWSECRSHNFAKSMGALTAPIERVKAAIRARVEHPFQVLKRQFGHDCVCFRGLAKNKAQLHTQFALSNLWIAEPQTAG